MLTVVSDTHAKDGHRLTGRTLDAVHDAAFVVHAGDFMTETVLDAFVDEAGTFAGVVGNNDTPAVQDRLPTKRVVESEGIRLVVVHGHEHSETALSMLGRQEAADLVVFGHSHRPGVHDAGEVTLLNPGSHAQPRRYRPAHAELEREGNRIRGRLVQPDGTVFEEFEIES
ncbi:metallophosphoesterase [Halorientalis salina]|uniref:metallophosphoesterase n=1 Tax=Halorientalis salina TaxID=2932266 RepID=UPI0010ABDBBC|nr:metallophosphoesterase [Halorientalis salina]